MLGYAEANIDDSDEEWRQRIHPDDKKPVLAALEEHLAGKTPIFKGEHRLRCQDGTFRWVLDRGVVIDRDADGKPLRMIGYHRNNTAHRARDDYVRFRGGCLELVSSGTPLSKVLGFIVRTQNSWPCDSLAEAKTITAKDCLPAVSARHEFLGKPQLRVCSLPDIPAHISRLCVG